jgi:hypothetical protein
VLCAATLVFASCTSSSSFTPPQPPPEPKSKPAPEDIDVLTSPRDLREDYVYPPDGTRQIIRWQKTHATWTIQFSSRRYSYADIVMRKPYDFTGVKDKSYLTFSLEPAHMANYLSVGLVDGDITPGHILVDIPLVRGPAVTDKDARTFRVPLPDFGNAGLPVTTGEGVTSTDRQPFDWTDVREIRFSTFGKLPRDGIVIRDVHFKR